VGEQVSSGTALKDQDMLNDKNYLKLNAQDRILFEEQIKLDALFFKQNAIIDYSLLIGYHRIRKSKDFSHSFL
jgi:hypothetical protein